MANQPNIIVIEPVEKEYAPGFVPGMNTRSNPIVIEPETPENELEHLVPGNITSTTNSNKGDTLKVKFPLKRKFPASGKVNPKAQHVRQKPPQPSQNNVNSQLGNLLTVKFPLKKKLPMLRKLSPKPTQNVNSIVNDQSSNKPQIPLSLLNLDEQRSLIDPVVINRQINNKNNPIPVTDKTKENITEKTDSKKKQLPPSKKLVNSKEIKAQNANIRKSKREKKATKFSDCVRLDSESDISSSEEDDEDEDSEESDDTDSVCTVCHSYEPPIEFERGSDVASFELKWIDCDHCHKWFHWFCVGIFNDEEDTNFFKCKICKTKSTTAYSAAM